jgi:tripartite-type tricarboxylate transporter receptor subunit TctC
VPGDWRHPAAKYRRFRKTRGAAETIGQGARTMKRWRIGMIMVAGLAVLAPSASSLAQESFPDHPIRMINPYSVGSVADVFGRIVAQNMAAQWNGTILAESKSGANGSLAAEEVARAAPDGYTWLLVTAYFASSPSLYNNLRWDPQRDFIAVGQICRAPNVFIVPTSLPVRNVAEFVALAKSKPGALNYGHPGKGSTGHLGFELFKRLAGIEVAGIGYRGYPQMAPDLASGQIAASFFSVNQALSLVQTGTIRVIATINDSRTKYFPDSPTLAEQGYAEAKVTPWFGIAVPKGTPAPIVERISKALEAALATPEVREKLDVAGCEAKSAPQAQFADIIKADIALLARVVKDAGITAD